MGFTGYEIINRRCSNNGRVQISAGGLDPLKTISARALIRSYTVFEKTSIRAHQFT